MKNTEPIALTPGTRFYLKTVPRRAGAYLEKVSLYVQFPGKESLLLATAGSNTVKGAAQMVESWIWICREHGRIPVWLQGWGDASPFAPRKV